MKEVKKVILDNGYAKLVIENNESDFSFDFNSKGNNSHFYIREEDTNVMASFALFISIMKDLQTLGYIKDMKIKSCESDDTLEPSYFEKGIDLSFSSPHSKVVVSKSLEDTRGLEHFFILFDDLEYSDGEIIEHQIDDYESVSDLKLILRG